MGADGTPTGCNKEQAGIYVDSFLFPVDMVKANLKQAEQQLLSGRVLGMACGIENWMNADETLTRQLARRNTPPAA